MNDEARSLTEFEYPALVIGREELAEELEKALQSGEVHEHVQRPFYLDRAVCEEGEPLTPVVLGYADTRYQIVFIDATSPDVVDDRIECIRALKEHCPSSEIVVLISERTERELVRLLEAGAWYFLEVPIQPGRLAPMLVRVVAFREADRLVRTDGLTGLYNRAFFEDALRDQIARLQHNIGGQRSTETPPVSLLIADLDNFQEAFGDRHELREGFLRDVARIFRRGYRLTDIVARIGGDEFGVLLIGVNYTLALMRGEILRKEVSKLPLPPEVPVHPTLSVGVVTYPSFLDDPRQLYWYARRALSRAKASGGNVVYGFDVHGTPMPFAEIGS